MRRARVVVVAPIVFAIIVPISSVLGWAGYLQLSGNFHVVDAGVVYRSNTLGSPQLAQVLKQNGIRTILNLRGAAPGQPWYDSETRIAREHGVTMIDIAMEDNRMPTPEVREKLIAALRTADRPLLIHCKAGADRTGLAAALFELLVVGEPASVAADQLSFFYGHFPWLGSPTVAMDETFWMVAANLAADNAARRPKL